MHVIATAGHVDHGKSTLVRALTGTDPDRLAEERRRGLTIELGYAWADLGESTGGDDGPFSEVAFVDVPGHERFVATALSGLGPVPAVLLVVAADDPWMPQAEEHLAALLALGVEHGVVAVTRSDLADAAPAGQAVRARLAGTPLAGSPVLPVSAVTGSGLSALRGALGAMLARLPASDPDADVRLWVDRSFTMRGAGAVVTGTLQAGTVREGDRLTTSGRSYRVRRVESAGRPRSAVRGAARVALNLAGSDEPPVRGEALLSPGAFGATDTVDVRVGGDADELPREPLAHLGTAQVGARVRTLDTRHVRLHLARPLPLRVGDRLLLRDPGRRRVWRADVLDPRPPSLDGRGAGRARAAALAESAATSGDELRRRGAVSLELLRHLGVPLEPMPDDAVRAGSWLLSAQTADRVRRGLAELLGSSPDGRSSAEVARAFGLPDEHLPPSLLPDWVRVREGRLYGPDAEQVPADLAEAATALAARFDVDPLDAPDAPALDALGLDARGLARLDRAGRLVHLGGTLAVGPGAVELAVESLSTLDQPFTASAARQAWGVSRRVALPLLAHLDKLGRTVRLADDTRRLRG